MIRILPKPRGTVRIGPDDNGRPMSLDQFDCAIGEDGYRYELSRGVIEVTEIPAPSHGSQVDDVRDQLGWYRREHPKVIQYVGLASDAKVLVGEMASERHPDLSIYLTPRPATTGREIWSLWVPEVVIEVVSPSSRKRDYEQKPDEYFAFGVSEYWIIDAPKKFMTVLTRWRGTYKKPGTKVTKSYASPLLPGFTLDLKTVFTAAAK